MTCSVNGPTSDIDNCEKHRAQPQAIQPHKSQPYKCQSYISQIDISQQNSGGQQGFTLVELMVATVLSLWVVTAATNMAISAINNQRQLDAAREVDQTGAYLSQHLQRQLSMAGFFGPLDVVLPELDEDFTPAVCTASPGSDDLAVPVRGQKNDADDFKLICVGDSDDHTVLSGTHVLTLMRASTETIASASLDSDTYYIQSNHRKLEVDLGSNSSSFDLTNINDSDSDSDIREYVSYVYFVDRSNTFRRLRYKDGEFISEPLANNVTDFQVTYFINDASFDPAKPAEGNVTINGRQMSNGLPMSSTDSPPNNDDVVAIKAVVSVENTVDTTIKQFSVFSMLYNPSLRRLSEVLTDELE
ncbi:MAG: prepilin-type N-terminal cleavage/methylation domain-containing protein [Porticoccaceae bacterium]|nr:prepilin-type N-terminal cleavage/methylation domain-containing protein [Porticoccaceae bacterium]